MNPDSEHHIERAFTWFEEHVPGISCLTKQEACVFAGGFEKGAGGGLDSFSLRGVDLEDGYSGRWASGIREY